MKSTLLNGGKRYLKMVVSPFGGRKGDRNVEGEGGEGCLNSVGFAQESFLETKFIISMIDLLSISSMFTNRVLKEKDT
jgi:hypothetical protein